MSSTNYAEKISALVFNLKLRLIVSALFSIMGLAFLISTGAGFVVDGLKVLDQTIVGVAVFVIVIPVYLIVADLPKIDEHTIAHLLNEAVPELKSGAQLMLKSPDQLTEEEITTRKEIEHVFEDEKLYRFLPNRPIKQAVVIMLVSLIISSVMLLYF